MFEGNRTGLFCSHLRVITGRAVFLNCKICWGRELGVVFSSVFSILGADGALLHILTCARQCSPGVQSRRGAELIGEWLNCLRPNLEKSGSNLGRMREPNSGCGTGNVSSLPIFGILRCAASHGIVSYLTVWDFRSLLGGAITSAFCEPLNNAGLLVGLFCNVTEIFLFLFLNNLCFGSFFPSPLFSPEMYEIPVTFGTQAVGLKFGNFKAFVRHRLSLKKSKYCNFLAVWNGKRFNFSEP